MKKITQATYLKWYEDMFFWRKFEDKLAAVYIQQKVRGFLHLYNGQEAILAGALHAMELGRDRMITAYRNHVQPIAVFSPDTVNSLGLTLKNISSGISFIHCLNGPVSFCVPFVSNVIELGKLACFSSSLYMPILAACPVIIKGSPPVKHKC